MEVCTFLDAYYRLSDAKIPEMPELSLASSADRYVTEDGVVIFGAYWRLRSAMHTLIGFARQGMPPGDVMWFYYDHDVSSGADELYVFFAVHGGKVVPDSCHFSPEEPLVLERKQDDDPIWRTHPLFDKALERYWYRKFYTETLTGQLMVLRPDEPTLYHYAL